MLPQRQPAHAERYRPLVTTWRGSYRSIPCTPGVLSTVNENTPWLPTFVPVHHGCAGPLHESALKLPIACGPALPPDFATTFHFSRVFASSTDTL